MKNALTTLFCLFAIILSAADNKEVRGSVQQGARNSPATAPRRDPKKRGVVRLAKWACRASADAPAFPKIAESTVAQSFWSDSSPTMDESR